MLLVDSGNFSDNPTPQGDAKTRALVEAMGKIGYAAANVGERDVKLGPGEYMLVYGTDDSHSAEEFNAAPPDDLFHQLARNAFDQILIILEASLRKLVALVSW